MMNDLINEILKRVLDLEFDYQIKPQDLIQDDLGADSLNVVELILELEHEFDIEISDDAGYKIKTVQDLNDLIQDLI